MGFTEEQLDAAEDNLAAKGYPPEWIDQELLFTEVADPGAVATVAGGAYVVSAELRSAQPASVLATIGAVSDDPDTV